MCAQRIYTDFLRAESYHYSGIWDKNILGYLEIFQARLNSNYEFSNHNLLL